MDIARAFSFEDHRPGDAVARPTSLGTLCRRTGLDGRTQCLDDFEKIVTFCFTPESEGLAPHHTSPPKDPMYFADFCARMIERYAPAQPTRQAAFA